MTNEVLVSYRILASSSTSIAWSHSTCTPAPASPPTTRRAASACAATSCGHLWAQDCLTELPDGRYQLRLKRAWSDGTRAVVFEGPDLCAKLAVMVPPPRMHRTRFFGVFSSHARLRSSVVPRRAAAPDTKPPACSRTEAAAADADSDFTTRRRLRWARLLARVFAVDVLACEACGSNMVMLAGITEPNAIRRILDAVGCAADSPATA
jgi:hypothetical protein